MKWAALVPVRRLSEGKTRLRAHFGPAEVEALGRAMLLDVLSALVQSRVAGVFTLTDDAQVEALTRGASCEAWVRSPDPGLNPAIDGAEREVALRGFEATLVVPADLPLLRARDIDRVIELGERHNVVVAPAADGGTALLARQPIGIMDAHFGPDSAAEHAREALRLGFSPRAFADLDESACRDLDTLADAQHLLEQSERDSRTLTLLREFLGSRKRT